MNPTTVMSEASSFLLAVREQDRPSDGAQFDYQLARRIAAGDIAAFEEFYGRYHRRVYSLCLRMTGSATEAEDLTQEIFIHVYQKIGGFRGEATMTTWLHRVTVNKVLMYFRKAARRREQTTEDGESPEPGMKYTKGSTRTPILDRIALENALAQLSPGYRAVLLLHDVEGYEHSEVARICGISSGTSKSQLHKARRRLYELLKGAGEV